MIHSPRSIAMHLLMRTEQDGAYSNLILDTVFVRENLSQRDRAFVAALFYGVLERDLTLDFIISRLCGDKGIESAVRRALKIGLYQLLYMDGVPDSAAVNESVKLAGHSGKGFVNGVLRSFIRSGKTVDFSGLEGNSRLSAEYSCPEWLVELWTGCYGREAAEEIMKSSLGRPPLYIKANDVRYNADIVSAELEKDGVTAEKVKAADNCLAIKGAGGVENLKAFHKGMFHVQDISSQLCCKLVRPAFNGTVIDLCAAPGGKSFTMAQIMRNRGRLIACDMYELKVHTLKSGAERLGLSIIDAVQNDAKVFNGEFPEADNVLCYVPCSGLGVIRRKPEIKYKPPHSIEGLQKTQLQILETSARYVKQGGILAYSTCTLNKAENEDVTDSFLQEHTEFAPYLQNVDLHGVKFDGYRHTFLPGIAGGDGFYVALFKKK